MITANNPNPEAIKAQLNRIPSVPDSGATSNEIEGTSYNAPVKKKP
jgi:hypothetical protein